MNNLNPLFEMKQRLMKKIAKASMPQAFAKTARQAEKGYARFSGKGLTDNGNVKGRLGDLYGRMARTKKGQAILDATAKSVS